MSSTSADTPTSAAHPRLTFMTPGGNYPAMGKTNPTYRNRLDDWEADWQSYRRALRRERREHFDELVVIANELSMAGGYQNAHDVATPLLVSVCVCQKEALSTLKDRVDALSEEVSVDV